MKVKLNNNVFLVNGAVYDCIYDLNTQQMYRINKKTSNLISECCKGNIQIEGILRNDQKQLLQHLISEGILCSEDSQLETLLAPPENGKLQTVWLEITQHCNFRCVHCYEGETARVSMSLKDITRIIDILTENSVKHLHLIGGEPMLHPQIEVVLKYCFGKFESVSVYTNASAISPSICELLKELNATVYVSLNSDIEDDFNHITRTHNLFPKVLNGIDLLKRYMLDVVIKRVKVSGVSVSRQYETFYGNFGGFPILVGNASLQQYNEEMLQNKIITENSFRGKLDRETILINMRENYCFRNRIYVDAFGNIYPCAMERRAKHGNIFQISLRNISDSQLAKTTKDYVRECCACEYRYACNTCYVDTLSKDFYAKPWFCSYQPLEGKWTLYDEFVQSLKARFL